MLDSKVFVGAAATDNLTTPQTLWTSTNPLEEAANDPTTRMYRRDNTVFYVDLENFVKS